MKLFIGLQNYDENFSVDAMLDHVDGNCCCSNNKQGFHYIHEGWIDNRLGAQHLSTGIGNKLRWKNT
jgi:hypothetical protein